MVGKSSVVIVDVQNIIRQKIIRYIDVFPAIEINIGNDCAMPKSIQGNTSLVGNIMKNGMLLIGVPIILV